MADKTNLSKLRKDKLLEHAEGLHGIIDDLNNAISKLTDERNEALGIARNLRGIVKEKNKCIDEARAATDAYLALHPVPVIDHGFKRHPDDYEEPEPSEESVMLSHLQFILSKGQS